MRVPRWTVWALVGGGAVAAGLHFGEQQRPEIVAAVPDAGRESPAGEAEKHRRSTLEDFAANPARDQRLDGRGQLFAGRDWAPARKAASGMQPQPEARPDTPPFPYKYAGWARQGPRGKPTIYLSKGGELVDVDAGEVLDGAWKIHSVSEERIDVTFLATGQQLAVQVSAPVRQEAPGAVHAARASASPPVPVSMAAGGRQPFAQSGGGVAAPPPIALAAGAAGVRPPLQSAGEASARTPIDAAIDEPAGAPAGRLGTEVPVRGSMPTGPAPSGSDPSIGPASGATAPPQGRLGE